MAKLSNIWSDKVGHLLFHTQLHAVISWKSSGHKCICENAFVKMHLHRNSWEEILTKTITKPKSYAKKGSYNV